MGKETIEKCSTRKLEESKRHSQKTENGLLSKLTRLKMQEHLISNHNVLSTVLKEFADIDNTACERKTYLNNLKKPYFEIKSLFEGIKNNVNSEEKLKLTDIEDIRKDVLNLEQNILSFKNHLQREMAALKEVENVLNIKIKSESNDCNIENTENVKKMHVKPYNSIVPSPVKAMIDAPNKTKEVQRYQDFLREHGRYGGWSDTYHNAFLSIYQKYNCAKQEDRIRYVVDEMIQKIPGLTPEEILRHNDWYNLFKIVKDDQQKALKKWRESKSILKLQQRTKINGFQKGKENSCKILSAHKENKKHSKNWNKDSSDIHMTKNNDTANDYEKESGIFVGLDSENNVKKTLKMESKKHLGDNKTTYMQYTEQWINRCKNFEYEIVDKQLSINDVSTLMIPKWRRHIN